MTLQELIRKEILFRMADRLSFREQQEYEAIKEQLVSYDEKAIEAEYTKIFA